MAIILQEIIVGVIWGIFYYYKPKNISYMGLLYALMFVLVTNLIIITQNLNGLVVFKFYSIVLLFSFLITIIVNLKYKKNKYEIIKDTLKLSIIVSLFLLIKFMLITINKIEIYSSIPKLNKYYIKENIEIILVNIINYLIIFMYLKNKLKEFYYIILIFSCEIFLLLMNLVMKFEQQTIEFGIKILILITLLRVIKICKNKISKKNIFHLINEYCFLILFMRISSLFLVKFYIGNEYIYLAIILSCLGIAYVLPEILNGRVRIVIIILNILLLIVFLSRSHILGTNPKIYTKISTCQDLKNIEPTKNYKLTKDINCQEVKFSSGLEEFKGEIYGDNHTISNLKVKGNLITKLNKTGVIDYINLNNYEGDSIIKTNNGIIGSFDITNSHIIGENMVGIVGINNGYIHGVSSENVVLKGKSNVGTVAGINNGKIKAIEIYGENSKIQGETAATGIFVGANSLFSEHLFGNKKSEIKEAYVDEKIFDNLNLPLIGDSPKDISDKQNYLACVQENKQLNSLTLYEIYKVFKFSPCNKNILKKTNIIKQVDIKFNYKTGYDSEWKYYYKNKYSEIIEQNMNIAYAKLSKNEKKTIKQIVNNVILVYNNPQD
ncbi:MAG: hypothetical protein ACK5HR_07265 [Mycoplasmatales bacterium]